MNLETIVEGVAVLVLGSVISYAVKRFLSRGGEQGIDVKRRRRRPLLGQARREHGPHFEIEDISVSGALLRTKGFCHLRHNQSLNLDLMLSDGSTALVKAIVVRTQRPSWKRGLTGGVGISFRFNGEEDPNKSVIESFVSDSSN
jgi:hypothetical protein